MSTIIIIALTQPGSFPGFSLSLEKNSGWSGHMASRYWLLKEYVEDVFKIHFFPI